MNRLDYRISQMSIARIAAICGIVGPIMLALYFNTPALTNCPCGSASPELAAFIRAHPSFLYAGVWFQVIGTLLSILFFLSIVHLAGAAGRLSGMVTIVACASLLSLVLIEAATLAAVAQAVAAGDTTTYTTSFTLGTVFIRLYPLAPASVTYIGLGAVILGSTLVPRWFGYIALALGISFESAGLVAVFSQVGLTLVVILATVQELWIILAAIALWRWRPVRQERWSTTQSAEAHAR